MVKGQLSWLTYMFMAVFWGITPSVTAHAHDSRAQYIANEGVLVTHQDAQHGALKILFDPLPRTGFGTYMDVPASEKHKMMNGLAPYDDIAAVFISHAHRDHFSAKDMIAFMKAQPKAVLAAPRQALDMMKAVPDWDAALLGRMYIFNMDYGDAAETIDIGPLKVSAVRIPHSGWPAPRRAMVQNMVFQVTLGGGPTVMHMGDADVRRAHYAPFVSHWAAQDTHMAFPPYWFLLYPDGKKILREDMNVKASIGTHVPLDIPADLIASGEDYFSKSGETRDIGTAKDGCEPLSYGGAKYTVCGVSTAADIGLFWGKDGVPFGDFDAVNTELAKSGKRISFAVNAGMYHKNRKPVGLYIENEQTLQSLSTKAGPGNFHMLPNGVFWAAQDGGKLSYHVTTTQAFQKAAHKKIKLATQSGPVLVIEGKLHPKFQAGSTSKKRRNGVGLSPDGKRLYFVISEEAVNFHSFASLFKDHLKTPNALYLDGTISRLYDQASGRNDGGLPMGPILAVVEDIKEGK